jgi:hypothetical protein
MRATQNINRTGRTAPGARLPHILFTAAMMILLCLSCVDNDISFFIEHVKIHPKSPACTYNESDDVEFHGTLDVVFGNSYTNGYLVRNQLMSREDYDNLKAETNGVLVDSYDVVLRTLETNEEIGVSDRLPSELYIPPESSDVVITEVLTPPIVSEIAASTGCLRLNRENYPEETMFEVGTRTDSNGLPVPRELGTVNASLKFYGHSQGGKDVKTQRFTFPIRLCCGCLVKWSLCDELCGRYCTETADIEDHKMCVLGVANGEGQFDCRDIYRDLNRVWSCLEPSEEAGEEGQLVPANCNCKESCKAK